MSDEGRKVVTHALREHSMATGVDGLQLSEHARGLTYERLH